MAFTVDYDTSDYWSYSKSKYGNKTALSNYNVTWSSDGYVTIDNMRFTVSGVSETAKRVDDYNDYHANYIFDSTCLSSKPIKTKPLFKELW